LSATDVRPHVQAYADRWVLTGWLDGPDIPLGPAAEALASAPYDALRESDTAKLLLARNAGPEVDPTPGLDDLRQATLLALIEASSDRASELGAWSDLKYEVGDPLETDDPIGFLLERSGERLRAAAGHDVATGGALLAIAARRWRDTCSWKPCTGMDRSQTMSTASRWHDDIRPLAATWRVIALKQALDSMEVGQETVLFPHTMVELCDALLGLGAGPLAADLLRHRSPDPAVWSGLSEGVGTSGVSDWAGARAALGGFLSSEAHAVQSQVEDPEWIELLEKISRRAH
jgi:hypothetical protein